MHSADIYWVWFAVKLVQIKLLVAATMFSWIKLKKYIWVLTWEKSVDFGGQIEWVCLKRTQLPRVTYTFYSQVEPMAIWQGYEPSNKISTSLLVVIRMVRYKWHMLIVQLWDGVSDKNTQFPDLPTGLRQEGHPTVKLSASIKSCKMSNNAMSYNRVISNRDGVVSGQGKD